MVDKEVSAKQLLETVRKAGSRLIRNAEIFDIYEGEHVSEGRKSVAMRVTYQAEDHTLKDDDITEIHDRILELLHAKLNAELRS